METTLLPSGHKFIKPGQFELKGDNKRYPHGSDAQLRLLRTIVRWQGEPVYVSGVYDGTLVLVWDMKSGSQLFVVDSNDSRLDVSSQRMGFVNYGGRAYYAARRAIRSQRQGVEPSRCLHYDISKGRMQSFDIGDDLLIEYRNMLTRRYPTVKQIVDSDDLTGAFGPTWAIRKTGSKGWYILFHRMEAIGWFNKTNKTFSIKEDQSSRLRLKSLSNVLLKQYDGVYDVK